MPIFPEITAHITAWTADIKTIADDRKGLLDQLVAYVRGCQAESKAAKLTFICTHNSRRSHLSQVWAKVMADYYGVGNIETYSGGTEATAFHPNAIQALRSQGFSIETSDETTNPHYQVSYGAEVPSLEAWSKVYNDARNPQVDYGAVMTCVEADEACPVVFGASARIALPFIDPKVSDGTPEQDTTYAARSQHIATEMAYVFAQLAT